MRRFQYAVAVIMTAVICLMPVLQPYAAYAEVLAAERQLYGTSDSSAAEDGAGTSAATEDGSADEGSAGEEASSSTGGPGDGSAAVEPTQPSDAGSETAGTADSAADASTEDAQVTADETADAAAEDGERDISADEFRGNSWRFENGQLIGGLDDESARSGNFRARAMNALPEGATAQGIDVSEFQYQINWDAVKASGVDFAIIRIGWWNNGVDKYFERNVAECERLGIPWGAYLYSYSMDAEDAASEANHAIDLMNQMKAKGYTPDLPVYLDLEDKEVPLDAAKLATISSTFNGKIAAAGYEPGVYASASWWKNYLTSPVFDSWSKWSAQYYSVCEAPSDPDMWQYTSSGSVPGISGPVDVNYWLSDPSFTEEAQRAELDALAEENRGALADGTYAVVAGVGSRKVLDVASGSKSDGANVQIYASNATSAQRWRVSHDGDGYVTLVNVGSGKALDVSAGRTAPGTNVQQYASNGTWSQKWVAVPDGGGFRLVSALDPRIVLDVASASSADGANVQVYTGNGSAAQRFSFVSASPDVAPCEDVLPDGWFTLSPASSPDSVADIASASSADGADARLYGPNGTLAQLFEFRYVDGYYLVVNASSGKALDVADGDVVPGANVQQWTAGTANANQLFSASDNGDGTWTLVNKGTGLALSASGSDLVGAAPDGSASQRFRAALDPQRAELDALAEENRGALADGTYAVVAGVGSRKVLDVASGSKSDGANVQIYASNATSAQRWRVSHDGDGYVTLVNVGSGKALDVSAGRTAPGTNVQQYASNGTWSQKWVAVPDGGGFRLVSALDPRIVLDVASASSADGANVQVYTGNGSAAQRFSFVSASPDVAPCEDVLPDGWFTLSPASSPDSVADIASASSADGADARLYGPNGTLAQLFEFRYVDGYYLVVNASSGKALDVADGDVVPGANVQQWTAGTANANQLFSASDNGDGTWTLVNKGTGLALSASGSDLVGAAPDGSASQRFRVQEYTYTISGGVYTINSSFNSGLVLEVSSASTSDSAAIQMHAANDTFSQKWLVTLVDESTNAYSIESLNSGKRLSATSSSSVGQRLPDSNDSAQLWIPNIEVGGISFVNLKYQDSILTMSSIASGKKVGLSSQSVGSPQLFTLNSSSDVVPNGTYFIRMAKNSGFVLDVDSGSKANGANVQVYSNNDSTAQKWDLTRNADGTYTICSAVSGKALDVANGSAVSGANVQQYEKNGSKAQKWYISYRDGGFVITSALNSKLVLNVDSGRTENGANVAIATSSDSHDAQRFTFASTSYVPVYRGFQNPSQYYQVSNVSVSIPHLGQGQFGYRTESRISIDATRQDCINAMVTRALEYSGTRYVWDYSCAPGVGVDCSGLVMQALYATGMDLSPMNPWDHYYTPGHDQYANYMWENGRFQKLSFSQRQPGDIIAYKGHVAIYLGNDQIVEASSPAGRVRISSVYSSPNIRGVLRPFV